MEYKTADDREFGVREAGVQKDGQGREDGQGPGDGQGPEHGQEGRHGHGKQTNEWWVRIGHAFSTHVRDEVYVLEGYEALARLTDDPGTRYLLELILADERRHHEVFEELAASAAVHPGPDAVTVPHAPHPEPELVPELLRHTRRFVELERSDATSLKALVRDLRPAGDELLWRLLVELMQLDTEKHLKILEYLERRLEEA